MGKVNRENVAGATFLFLASLFLGAGIVNTVIASINIVFYIFTAAGVALVLLGYRTY